MNILYWIEEEGEIEFVLETNLEDEDLQALLGSHLFFTKMTLPEIDWNQQWEAHAPHFSSGMVHLDLVPYGGKKVLLMKPGEGFGDLSHPTTRLMLKLMKGEVKGRDVIDIGSGSGVLTLASMLLHAKNAVGIEIDSKAISHANENAQLNAIGNVCFLRPEEPIPFKVHCPAIVLMNMIQEEQKIAWDEFLARKIEIDTLITSGVLVEERETYLDLLASWGFILEQEEEEEEWKAFRLKRK